MTSSDQAPTWIQDPLLRTAGAAGFLRASWDQDPTLGEPFATVPVREWPPVQSTEPLPAPSDEHVLAIESESAIDRAPPEELPSVSEQELAEARQAAYDEGFSAGLHSARQEAEQAAVQARDLVRRLSDEVASLQLDPERLYEPLRRMALHVAELLVRAELQHSGQLVNQLVKAALGTLDDAHTAPVQVILHPDDLARVRAIADTQLDGIQFESDNRFRIGSVRVRQNDTVVEDLMEHRLEAVARRLLVDPDQWLAHSVLAPPAPVR